MLDQLFLDNLWTVLGVWGLIYCSDYGLTIVCARMYQGGVNKHLAFESFELTPYYQKDVACLRWISPRFLLMLCLTSLLLGAAWGMQSRVSSSDYTRQMFRGILGSLFFLELAIHVRHFRNLLLFTYARRSLGIEGKVSYSSWLSYRSSAVDLAGFALLYLVGFLLTDNWFFGGGAIACFLLAFKHWSWSTSRKVPAIVTNVDVVAEHHAPAAENDTAESA